MAAVEKPSGIKLKAWLDDAISPVIGRRLFTDLMTDSSLRVAIKGAKKARGGALKPNASLLKSAAKAFNSVDRSK